VVSFSVAVASNYVWNRYWTFPESRAKGTARQLAEFALVSVIGLLIRTPIFAFLESPLRSFFVSFGPGLPLAPDLLGRNLALAVAVVVVLFWNFFVNRYWTFADVR